MLIVHASDSSSTHILEKEESMLRALILSCVILLLFGHPVLAGDDPSKPATMINSHILGHEKIGNLPQVPVPPDNPQTTLKILLGKQLYFDKRLSKDNTISCASCHDPAMGWSD